MFDTLDACLSIFILVTLYVNLTFASQSDVDQIDVEGRQI